MNLSGLAQIRNLSFNLYSAENGIRVRFYENVKSIAPGQSAVFYEGDEVMGGGIIQRGSLI